jgi:Zn-dependent protease with chaperone function
MSAFQPEIEEHGMKSGTLFFKLLVAMIILVAPWLQAGSGPSNQFEKEITSELAAKNPEAADLFYRANRARESGDHKTASELYGRVRKMVPSFVHAIRRQGYEEQGLGNRERAISLCREAVAMVESPENLSALALALVLPSNDPAYSAAANEEALQLAIRATNLAPDDVHSHTTLCRVALIKNDLVKLKESCSRLAVIAPNEVATHYYGAIAAVIEGRFDEALEKLKKARELGMAENDYEALVQKIEGARPWMPRLLSLATWTVSLWLAGIVLLFTTGYLLSCATLRLAGRISTQSAGSAQGPGKSLRQIYGLVLSLTSVYYYLSIPIVILLVLGLGGGLLYAFVAIGRVPVKLAVIILVLVLVTSKSILKSLFVRAIDEDPGLRLNLAEHPRIRGLLDEVAALVGTRAVDNVYLTPGTQVAVMERGSMLRQLAGKPERCLILGIGVLPGMKLRPFKSVLAHEYGHLSNRDTARGGFALSVRRSLGCMAQHLVGSGAALWYNPAWLFLISFNAVFLRISQGASRLQEVLADRWAALSYGSQAFEQGLRHVIERSVRFDAHLGVTLQEMVQKKQPLENLYSYSPETLPPDNTLEKGVELAFNHEPSPYDSHPSPASRITWIRALAAKGSAFASDDDLEVWNLFEGREKIERQMTENVRKSISYLNCMEIADGVESAATA